MKQGQTLAEKAGQSRLLFILVTIVFGASFTGFLVGTSNEWRDERPAVDVDESKGSVAARAVSYSEMSALEKGPNAEWNEGLRSQLGKQPDAPVYESQQQLRELKKDSLEARSKRRAYNGAPPVIPHPIEQRNTDACLVCHGEGMNMGSIRAPKMSHELYVNCTQCHAPPNEMKFEEALAPANHFEGVSAPLEGDRAWQGAPPIIPHSTHMRSDCLSCHGPAGAPGIRTSHPERRSCLQCHAPSATLDQRMETTDAAAFFSSLRDEEDDGS